MGGTITYVWRDGSRLTPFMLYQINRLDADFFAQFKQRILVTSGIRTNEEQQRIFKERYTLTPNGRRVYDTRWWNGRLWYRVSPAGTVAQPGTSNHEIQGSKAAVDIRDTGSDAGVTSKNSTRGRWLRANAWKYGLVASGDSFGEGWHFDVLNIFSAVPSGGGSITPKPGRLSVIHYHYEDHTARNGGRKLDKGQAFWLNTVPKAGPSQATNIVGGIGPYNIVLHVYATGKPGDALDVVLAWDDTKTSGPHSFHYNEHLVFDEDGKINASFPFIRSVPAGFAVYARMAASPSNKGQVAVQMFDSDALLIV